MSRSPPRSPHHRLKVRLRCPRQSCLGNTCSRYEARCTNNHDPSRTDRMDSYNVFGYYISSMICIQIHSSRATADIQPRAGTQPPFYCARAHERSRDRDATPFYCARAHERSRDRDATRESESAHTRNGTRTRRHDGPRFGTAQRHSPKVPIPQQLHRLQTPIMALQRGPRERRGEFPAYRRPTPRPPPQVRYDITTWFPRH